MRWRASMPRSWHDLLRGAGVDRPRRCRAIGAHGQTVRHRPRQFDGTATRFSSTPGALLAELSGIDVVGDFRSRDVAAGGQGAPLVPAFHRAAFGRPARTLAVLNLGGISNLTLLRADGRRIGFDCGPGNALMDLWCQRHTGAPFDADGRLGGQRSACTPCCWRRCCASPSSHCRRPRAPGRDLFNAAWLESRLGSRSSAPLRPTVQATLAELTALVCARDLHAEHLPPRESAGLRRRRVQLDI